MRIYRQDTAGPCWTCGGAGFRVVADGFATRCWVCQGDGWLSWDRIAVLGWMLTDGYDL